jgi:hypothetical protein
VFYVIQSTNQTSSFGEWLFALPLDDSPAHPKVSRHKRKRMSVGVGCQKGGTDVGTNASVRNGICDAECCGLWANRTDSFPDRDRVMEPKTAIQILAGSAVITALINTIWFAVSSLLQRLQQWWNAKSTVYPVAFSRGMTRQRYAHIKDQVDGFSCLHVRFGSDQYLSSLAAAEQIFADRDAL